MQSYVQATPIAALCSVLAVLGTSMPSFAQGVPVLTRERVIALVRERSPAVQVALVRAGEARARRVGADAITTTNPELGVAAGPRVLNDGSGRVIVDVVGVLSWPVDLSGARGARRALAERAVVAAEGEVDVVVRAAVADALDAWADALAADARFTVERERAALDDELAHLAIRRRDLGASGDEDPMLADLVASEQHARTTAADGECTTARMNLGARIGTALEPTVVLAAPSLAGESPVLADLLAVASHRADVRARDAMVNAARAEVDLQSRLGTPLPRVSVSGGRDNEWFARGGIDVPLPVYQHNQTETAVARARLETARAEANAIRARAMTEVRSAFAHYESALRVSATLDATSTTVAGLDHLALRAYELGERDLTSVLGVRRETLRVRLAVVDARTALLRARIALESAAGITP